MAPTTDLLITPEDYDSVDAMADRAALAEDYGFEYVSMGETNGWNIVPAMAVIAERTDDLGICDDVISPYSRAPTVVAQAALTLQDISDGRFRLGLGTSSPAIAERWHAQDFDRPLRRLRETIEIVNEVAAGGRVSYEGEIYDFGGLKYECDPPATPLPVDVAGFGPTTTEMTGRFADGWIPQFLTPDGMRDRLADLRHGADLADRDPSKVRVSPIVRCCADEDGEAARELARKHVAFFLGAYGPYYGDSVARQGYEDVVTSIREAWDDRDTDLMAERLPDELLDELAAVGTPDEVREWVEDYLSIDGVDAVRMGFVNGMDDAQQELTMAAVSA
jgi:coenzyme F420-dependent oxidoreductase